MQQGPPGYGPPPGGGYGAPPGGGGYAPPPGGYGAPPGGQPPQGGYGAPPPPKKGMSGLTIALIVVGGLAVLGFGSCAVCVGVGAYAGNQAATAPRPAPEVVDIHTLLSEYKDNEVRADASYKSKWIQTEGLVKDVKKDVFDHPYLLLGTGAYFEIPRVQCQLDAKNAKTAQSLSKGTQVTIVGKVKGLTFNVQMQDCEITAVK